ncbi:MAG: hypothetical protein ACM30G_09570, partial [Micromonosporaceae bacterium]
SVKGFQRRHSQRFGVVMFRLRGETVLEEGVAVRAEDPGTVRTMVRRGRERHIRSCRCEAVNPVARPRRRMAP